MKQNYDDFCFLSGNKPVLISAPHAVEQTRNNVLKSAEPQTALISIFFNKKNYPCIIKTKNNGDDANYDINCNYKNKLVEEFKNGNVKFLLDLHQLRSDREMDFCIGTGGITHKNLLTYTYMADNLKNIISKNGFSAEINNPFSGGKHYTNSGYIAMMGYPSIQLEINSRILTHEPDDSFIKVLNVIEQLLTYIEEEIK